MCYLLPRPRGQQNFPRYYYIQCSTPYLDHAAVLCSIFFHPQCRSAEASVCQVLPDLMPLAKTSSIGKSLANKKPKTFPPQKNLISTNPEKSSHFVTLTDMVMINQFGKNKYQNTVHSIFISHLQLQYTLDQNKKELKPCDIISGCRAAALQIVGHGPLARF